MSTEFEELYSYPDTVYSPLGGACLGEPEDRDRHVEMWADALFEPMEVPSAKGGWERGDDVRHQQGLRVCKECGCPVMVWDEYDEDHLNRHRAWHDSLREAVQLVTEIRYERENDAEMHLRG